MGPVSSSKLALIIQCTETEAPVRFSRGETSHVQETSESSHVLRCKSSSVAFSRNACVGPGTNRGRADHPSVVPAVGRGGPASTFRLSGKLRLWETPNQLSITEGEISGKPAHHPHLSPQLAANTGRVQPGACSAAPEGAPAVQDEACSLNAAAKQNVHFAVKKGRTGLL